MIITGGGYEKVLLYISYCTICIVLLIIALIFFWWFTGKPYTKESFIVKAPYMVLVGKTTDGKVYYADVDVPMKPKWIDTGLTGVSDIAGSYGQLYTVSGSSIKYGPYDSATQTTVQGSGTQISADDANGFAVVNGTSALYSPTNTATTNNIGAATNISLSNGSAYRVNGEVLSYCASAANGCSWLTTSKTVQPESGVFRQSGLRT